MNRELREKLGIWARFRQSERFPQKDYHFERGVMVANWRNPSGLTSFGSHDLKGMLPDFPSSLDACFEWLVPKITGFSHIECYQDGEGWGVELHYQGQGQHRIHLFESKATTVALALCKAIEQYIDRERD